ncbi:AT-rich interactive domain-containing protein 2-like isoform X2 [Callorhinchus milii]|uniref:AT-rich interactive domain-containing protein 2-like isoform X2 n=1 Tax=Callorhinchus milii TaxID=7868 RepID=UPI001C3FE10D|nr:AT-rich interactive domain-containing protein 2-like isoform X2 [Callorhinchus milii]
MAKTPSKSGGGGVRTGRSFLDELRHFHRSKGTSFRKIPIIGGKELDLSILYSKVTSLGGFAKVTDKGLWADLLEEFNFPKGCANAAFALKQYYLRYLESYEKLHHFGEEDEVLTPTNSRPQAVVSGVHLFYNRHQHIIPESVRRGYGLFTDFTRIGDYNKVVLSLLSGLPNEVDFAINVCTLMSHGNKQVLQLERDPKVVTLLLAHAGIFDDSPGTYLNVYESEWKVKSGRDFIKFWKDTVDDHEVRELIGDKSQRSKEAACDDRWDSVLFHPPQKLGINDLEGQRVLQIAVIIHNLSMEEGNAKLLANRTCLRFLLLCAHNRHVSLRQVGLDTLGNVTAELDPIDFQSTQVIFHTITKCLYSSDKWFRIRGMEILANLCKIEENVDIICECVEQESYREIVNHLALQDILLLLASLEVLYMLSSLGEVTCTKIIKVERSIDQLVCLVSVDMQNFPPDALAAVKLVEQQSTVQQAAPEPRQQTATTEQASNNSTPATVLRPGSTLPVPSTNVIEVDSETFTCQWLNANFEECADSSIYRVDLYSEYLSLCSKLGSGGILTSTGFTKCLRLTFPNHTIKKIEDAGANGQSQFHVVGIKRRAVPFPITAFHQEQQTPNHSFATLRTGPVSNTGLTSIPVGLAPSLAQSPAAQFHRTSFSTSQPVSQIIYTTQTQTPGISTSGQQQQYCAIASKVPSSVGGMQPSTIQVSTTHPSFHSAATTVIPGNALFQVAATKVTAAVQLPAMTSSVHLPHMAVAHQSASGQQPICPATTVPVLHQTLPNAQLASRTQPVTSTATISQGQLLQSPTAQPVQVHLQYAAAPTTATAVQLPSGQALTIAGGHNSLSSQTFQSISPTSLAIVNNSTQLQQQQPQQSVQVIVGHQGQVYPASFHQIVLTNPGGISSAQLAPTTLLNPSTCGQVLSVQQPPIQVHVQQPSMGGPQSNTGETSVIKQLLLPKPPPHCQAGKLLLPVPQVPSSITRAQSPQVVYQVMPSPVTSVGLQPQSQQLVVSQPNMQILQPHGGLQTVQIIPGPFISTTSPNPILQGTPLNQQVTVTVVPNPSFTDTPMTQVNTNPANNVPADQNAKAGIGNPVLQVSGVPCNQSSRVGSESGGERNTCQKTEEATNILSSQYQEQTIGLVENSLLGNAYNASNGHLNGKTVQTGKLLNGESRNENPASGMNHCGFVENTPAFQESKGSSGATLTNGDPILEKLGTTEIKNSLKRPLINGDSDFAKGDRSHIGKDVPNEKSVASNHLGNGEILNQEHQDIKCHPDGESSQLGKMCNGPSSVSNVKSHAHTTVIVPNPTVQQAHRNSVLSSGTAAVTFNVPVSQPHQNGSVVLQSYPVASSPVAVCQSSSAVNAPHLSQSSAGDGQPCRQATKRPGEEATAIAMADIPNKVGVRIMTVSDPAKAGSNTMMVAVPAGATINTAAIAGVPKVASPGPVCSQTVTQHQQHMGAQASQVPVSSAETEPVKKPSHSFMCLWKDCKRWFETPSRVFYHAATQHGGKDVYQGQCMWEGCEPLPRQRLSFITHLQDKHCSRENLLVGLKRLEQKAQLSSSQTTVKQPPSESTAPTPKTQKTLVSHPSAALMALRKGSRNLIFRNYMDEKEGPIVKHIRLTSALILKNVARYSEIGRTLLKRHENNLSVLAISGMEASTALAKCLYELNSQEQSEPADSKR